MSQNIEICDIRARRVAASQQSSAAYTAHQSPACLTLAAYLGAALQGRFASEAGPGWGQASGLSVVLSVGVERGAESERQEATGLMCLVADRAVKKNRKIRPEARSW